MLERNAFGGMDTTIVCGYIVLQIQLASIYFRDYARESTQYLRYSPISIHLNNQASDCRNMLLTWLPVTHYLKS
jgi:hypothetical protein